MVVPPPSATDGRPLNRAALPADRGEDHDPTIHDIDRDQLHSFDFGLVGGLGLNFGPMQVGARYNYGLTEIANSDVSRAVIGDAKNSCAQLYLAFNFNQNKEGK